MSRTLLFVDDDVDVREAFGDLFDFHGWTVVHAADGQEALDWLEANPAPTAILLDLKMPRVDGFEVLRRLKESPQTAPVPVIVLTTTDDPREIARCYELGCNVYITKPVEYDAFIEAVRRLGFFLQVVKLPSGHRFASPS